MLLSRQQRGDRHKAASLLHEAHNTACELGMRTLESRITACIASLPTSPQGAPAYPDGLTAREVEVLGLIARGQSNQEIADTLFISPRTVAAHVANIFNKTNAATVLPPPPMPPGMAWYGKRESPSVLHLSQCRFSTEHTLKNSHFCRCAPVTCCAIIELRYNHLRGHKQRE
jgi:DNA-binding CsgD family transcriptional regulator